MFEIIETWWPYRWATLSAISAGSGLAGFFLFDLIALYDPDARTVSQQLREFNTWGWESYLLTCLLPGVFYFWYIIHLVNPDSP